MKSYLIDGPDNGEFAYDENHIVSCSKCGRIDREKSRRNAFEKLNYEVSGTYDNELLVSSRVFDLLCGHLNANNFEQAGSYYYVFPKQEVTFNSIKRQVKFGHACNKCGQPSHVIGISPAFLTSEIQKSGMYSTDLHFGDVADSGRNLTPGIILTEDILELIIALNPSGLEYEPTHC